MFYESTIRSVHLEITTRCNAACPMCKRNLDGGKDNPNLSLTELSLEDIKTIMPPSFVANLEKAFMCGTYGDPVSAKDTKEVYHYLRECNDNIRLGMHTNAGARTPVWWHDLGKILNRPKDYCEFGIDGLTDTNHLYRRNTNFERVIENAKAFIDGGGQADWIYIVFKHNEHQVEEAQQMAKDLGFRNFFVRKTHRFEHDKETNEYNYKVYNREGEFEYLLEVPTIEKYRADFINTAHKRLIEKYGSMGKYYDDASITCKAIHGNPTSIYVSAQGLVMPCCFTSSDLYRYIPNKDVYSTELWRLLRKTGGVEQIDGRKHSIEEIINSDFYLGMKDSWTKPNCGSGKLGVCALQCGSETNLSVKHSSEKVAV